MKEFIFNPNKPLDVIRRLNSVKPKARVKKAGYQELMIARNAADLNTSIYELDLGMRVINALEGEGALTLGHIIDAGLNAIKRVPNIGKGSIKRIIDCVHSCGYEMPANPTKYQEERERKFNDGVPLKRRVTAEPKEVKVQPVDEGYDKSKALIKIARLKAEMDYNKKQGYPINQSAIIKNLGRAS